MKILVYPLDPNPYQELLYSEMRIKGAVVDYLCKKESGVVVNFFAILPRIVLSRLRGYTIFHLHWTYDFVPGRIARQWKVLNRLLYWRYIFILVVVRLIGFKLVWTAHNVLPHEPIFGSMDLKARMWLVRLANLVIVHSKSTISELSSLKLIPRAFAVIPHGSYLGVYQNNILRTEARQIRRLNENSFVYLFLGQIRDYKGIDRLLEAYSHVQTNETVLMIAGECCDPRLRQLLINKRNDKTIIWHDGKVSESDLQKFFNAADIAVLPFKRVTTSGSALLALSFGKAIIIPALGDMANIPSAVAYKYDPAQKNGLEQAMISAMSDRNENEKRGVSARKYAESLSWTKIADATIRAFKDLFRVGDRTVR